jgi:hypothetical protein
MPELKVKGKWFDIKETKENMMSIVELLKTGKLKDNDIKLSGLESLTPYIIMYSKKQRLKEVV